MEATFVKKLDGFRGDARLYKLSETYDVKNWDGETRVSVDHVIVSAIGSAFDTGQAETYVFPATSDDGIADWGELDGSFQGGVDHEQAINGFLRSVMAGE